jgi:poly-beta-1,6-N-acetyl-D-glucosamine synthase
MHSRAASQEEPHIAVATSGREFLRYVIISPARDEEEFIDRILDSVAKQTVRPLRWILIDDGSNDGTPRIIEEFGKQHDWMTLLRKQQGKVRNPRPAVVHAFNAGYELVKDLQFEIVVKLDTDLELPPDYFERLLSKFALNKRLGIASGVYYEKSNTGLQMIQMPSYHAAGASKAIRRECFEQIGGFVPTAGWDTLDEIRAQMKGWETRHYEDIPFHHLRPEGSAIGLLRTFETNGRTYYMLGGGWFFFLLKCLRYALIAKPFLRGGVEMMKGYMRSLLSKESRAVNHEEARHYRATLRKRLFRSPRTSTKNSRKAGTRFFHARWE